MLFAVAGLPLMAASFVLPSHFIHSTTVAPQSSLHSFQSLVSPPAAHNLARLRAVTSCGAVTVFASAFAFPPTTVAKANSPTQKAKNSASPLCMLHRSPPHSFLMLPGFHPCLRSRSARRYSVRNPFRCAPLIAAAFPTAQLKAV